MMKKDKINKHYVSPVDIKIREFDAIHQPSEAQQAEMKKYAAIYKKRDQATPAEKPKKSIWD